MTGRILPASSSASSERCISSPTLRGTTLKPVARFVCAESVRYDNRTPPTETLPKHSARGVTVGSSSASIALAKPMIMSRPLRAMHCNERTVVSPPTPSKTRSTPAPPVASSTAVTKSSRFAIVDRDLCAELETTRHLVRAACGCDHACTGSRRRVAPRPNPRRRQPRAPAPIRRAALGPVRGCRATPSGRGRRTQLPHDRRATRAASNTMSTGATTHSA